MKNRLGWFAVVVGVGVAFVAFAGPQSSLVSRVAAQVGAPGKHHKSKYMPYKNNCRFVVTIEAENGSPFSATARPTSVQHYDVSHTPLLQWNIVSYRLSANRMRMTIVLVARDDRGGSFGDATGTIVVQTSDGTTSDPAIDVEPVDVDPCASSPIPIKTTPQAF